MPLAGFEPAIPAGDRPQTLALDRSATGIGHNYLYDHKPVTDLICLIGIIIVLMYPYFYARSVGCYCNQTDRRARLLLFIALLALTVIKQTGVHD